MKKNRLMCGTALTRRGWTKNETRLGRMIRDGEGHPGGESAAGGNNDAGNNGADGQSDGSQNNDGQSFDFGQFWNTENPDGNGDGQQQQDDGTDEGTQLGQQLLERVNNFRADDVFTPEAIEKMREGDLSGINSGIQTLQQNVMKQVLGMSAMMMQAFEKSVSTRFERLVDGRLQSQQTSQQDEQLLTKNFSSFSDPKMRPMIQGVFNQALKHSKNDRTKALDLTKGMLSMMGSTGFQDFGLPKNSNPDDNLGEGPSRLVQELLAR